MGETVQAIAAEPQALREQLEALSRVLRVMSASPGDTQPVFDEIVGSCSRLFNSSPATLWLIEGGVLKAHGRAGTRPDAERAPVDEIPLDRRAVMGACVIDRRAIHCPDLRSALAEFPLAEGTLARGYRSLMASPLMRDGEAVGCINVLRTDATGFGPHELALLASFADQASIAVESARLFRERERQSLQLSEMNRTLEARVQAGIRELEQARMLGRFLPPQVVDLVLSEGGTELLRHHRREIVAVFADLRGFTTFAETADPEEVMSVLNRYYAEMGGIVQEYGGTLDGFAGDGIMAFLNDPVPMPDFARRAARMALQMQESFAPLAAAWKSRGHDLALGIGMAQGYATLGTIGFEGRWDYAAIGTVCNLAARLCAEAGRGEILISQRLQGGLSEEFHTASRGDLRLKGFQKAMAAYALERVREGPAQP